MCSPVEHYVCFCLIFFLYKIEDGMSPGKWFLVVSPGKMVFGVVPSGGGNRRPIGSGLSL